MHAFDLEYDLTVDVESEPHRLINLVLDLDRLRELEPRVAQANWTAGSNPETIGASARIEVNIPFAVPMIQRTLGRSSFIVTLTAVEVGRQLAGTIEARGFSASFEIEETGLPPSAIRVVLRIHPKLLVGLLVAQMHGIFEVRGRRAIIRGIRRADVALSPHVES